MLTKCERYDQKGYVMNHYTELDGHDGMIMLLSESLIYAHNRSETGDPQADSDLVRALRQEGFDTAEIAKMLKVLRNLAMEC